jgi:hypothetical protein
MLDSIKKFILWNYERGTWQYDVFCLLIIAFIFLTPKSWFEKREKLATQTAQVVVKADDFTPGKTQFERRIKKLNEFENARSFEWQARNNSYGKTFYEINLR